MALEKNYEATLVDLCEALGGFSIKLNPFGYIGIPDRLCLLPFALIVFVEVKKETGVLARKQHRWSVRLRNLGFRVETIYSERAVLDFIAEIRSEIRSRSLSSQTDRAGQAER